MWGARHGKNYSWSMGCHWLACCFAFSATIAFPLNSFCETTLTDLAYLLANIRESVGDRPGPDIYPNNTIWEVLNFEIGPNSSEIANDVSSMQSFFHDWDNYFRDISQSTYDISVDTEDIANYIFDFCDDYQKIYGPSYTNALRDIRKEISKSIDTNQYYLASILDELRKQSYKYYDASFLNDSLVHGHSLSTIYNGIWFDATNNYWQLLLRDYGLWQAIAMQPFFDYDISQLEGRPIFAENLAKEKWPFLSSFRTIFGTGSQNDASAGQINTFFSGGLGYLKMKYYGTYHITDAITNTVLTTDSNNHTITNQALLDQILSTAQYQALYRENGQTFSNTVAAIAPTVGGNTNDVYIASYDDPTNSSLLASITTNDWLNADYDKFTSDFDEDDFVDKFEDSGFRDFDSKLESVFSGTINDLQSAADGVWIIRLGNVTLGDYFSYTIPDIIVQRSTAWLNLVRKAFVALKAICVIAFFLFLWNKLRSLAM